MKKNFFKILMLFFIVAPLLLSSCASLFTKSTYPVVINTVPSGADVTIINTRGREVFSGQTPAKVKLKSSDGFFSKADYEVRINKPGYDEKVIPISADIEGWFFVNFIPPLWIGLFIDSATGAMWKLDTDEINITLKESKKTMNTAIYPIMDINDVPADMKDKLVLISK